MSTSAVESQISDIATLDESGEKNYQRLTRLIFRGRGRFTLAVIESDFSFAQSERIFERLKIDLAKQGLNLMQVRLDSTRFDLRDVPELNSKISPCDVILLTGWDETPGMYPEAGKPISRPPALAWLNILREHFRSALPVPILVWCSPFAYSQMLEHAPDFFDFSIGTFVFQSAIAPDAFSVGDAVRSDSKLKPSYSTHSSADVLYYEGLLQRNPDPGERRVYALIGLAEALIAVDDVDPAPRLKRAIAVLEDVAKLLSPEKNPYDWGRAQNNLGTAYSDLPSGDRGANLRRAIACYEAALSVRTETAFPLEWAETQQNIAVAYEKMKDIERAKEAVKKAIRGFRSCGLESNAELLERWMAKLSEP